jgi:hypothetical protein
MRTSINFGTRVTIERALERQRGEAFTSLRLYDRLMIVRRTFDRWEADRFENLDHHAREVDLKLHTNDR